MRRLLPLLAITAAAVFLGVALAPACGSQCSRSDDCAAKEVCSAGVCEPNSNSYVHCASARECDPNGLFTCRAGRCELKPVTVITPPDSGVVADTGTDGGMMMQTDALPQMDAMNMDATATTADGGPDAGMLPPDAGTPSTDTITSSVGAAQAAWNGMTDSAILVGHNITMDVTVGQATGNIGSPVEGFAFRFSFPGAIAGTYTCGTAGVFLEYADNTGSIFRSDMGVGTCTIIVTGYGPIGSGIVGTFSGTMQATVQGVPPPANLMPNFTGTFDVVRDADIP